MLAPNTWRISYVIPKATSDALALLGVKVNVWQSFLKWVVDGKEKDVKRKVLVFLTVFTSVLKDNNINFIWKGLFFKCDHNWNIARNTWKVVTQQFVCVSCMRLSQVRFILIILQYHWIHNFFSTQWSSTFPNCLQTASCMTRNQLHLQKRIRESITTTCIISHFFFNLVSNLVNIQLARVSFLCRRRNSDGWKINNWWKYAQKNQASEIENGTNFLHHALILAFARPLACWFSHFILLAGSIYDSHAVWCPFDFMFPRWFRCWKWLS